MHNPLYHRFRQALDDADRFADFLDDPFVPFTLKRALVQVRLLLLQRRATTRDGQGTAGPA